MMGWVWLACFALCSGRLALAHEDRVLLRVLGHRAGDGRQLPDAAAAAAPVASDAVPVPSADVPVSSVAVPVPSADVPVSSDAVPVPSAAVPASTVAPSVPSPAGLVTQSAAPADATTLRRRVTEATSLAPPLPPSLQDRKKAKKNSTLGEEVITTLIDGWSGESEDSKFGSEIREQFGFLVQAVTKLGAAAIDEYAKPSRTARAVDNVGEGRRRQVRRLLVRYLVLLKVFALGIILPGAVLLSLLQSWKAVTLSLMALLLAGVIGIRGLVNSAAKGQTAEVIHTTSPGGHYWRRVSAEQAPQDPDRLAYSAYVPVS